MGTEKSHRFTEYKFLTWDSWASHKVLDSLQRDWKTPEIDYKMLSVLHVHFWKAVLYSLQSLKEIQDPTEVNSHWIRINYFKMHMWLE